MKPIANQYFNEFIESKKLNISEFSDAVGVKRQTISKWLRGSEPNMASLNKVKDVFSDFNTEMFYKSQHTANNGNVISYMSDFDNKMLEVIHRIDMIMDKVMEDLSRCNIDKGKLMQENQYLKEQLKRK